MQYNDDQPEHAATGYRSFLLRVWTSSQSGTTRTSLTNVDTGEIHVFSDLEELYEWLMLVSEACPPQPSRRRIEQG